MAGDSGFRLVDVATDREVGRATVNAAGEWTFTDPDVEAMVLTRRENLGMPDDAILTYFDGWSNGHLKTAPL